MDIYYQGGHCSNCDEYQSVPIDQGVQKDDFDIKNYKCTNCGIKSVDFT